MVIEFILNDIKDKSKLYKVEQIEKISRFTGMPETIESIEYVGKNYCKTAIDSVVSKVTGIKTCEYKGALERIGNESFQITTDLISYSVTCTIDTYQGNKTRMQVKIVSNAISRQTDEGVDQTDSATMAYDHLLEKLKIEIKKAFRNDWSSCVWIKDEQSESLCSLLYPCIFRAENRVRAFANKVLIWELGTNWIASPGLEKYAESHKELCGAFRSKEPSFADVDDVFISTTLETLFEIIKDGVVYETPFALSKEQYNELLKIVSKAPKDNVAEWLKKKRTVKKNLWSDIFEQYFCGTENSQQIITDFILNRNHIAHNKPISFNAYQIMSKSFSDFDDMVKQANDKFEESVPSEEYELTIDILNEQALEEAEQLEYEKNYLRDRIYGETGIDIRWHNEIFEMLSEKCDLLYQTIHDIYYWDNRYSISSANDLNDDENWQVLFSITCNACEPAHIEVQISMAIDEEMDSESYLYLRCIVHGKDGEIVNDDESRNHFAILYHNGSGCENLEEGTIEPTSESYLDDSAADDFLDELSAKIENLNPYIAIKEYLEMLAAKEGGNPPVAEFPCLECERFGVSISEDFYKFGCCCYCGSDNEVSICERCGTPFGDGGGSGGFCNSCLDYVDNE